MRQRPPDEGDSNLIVLPGARGRPFAGDEPAVEEDGDLRPPPDHLVEAAIEAILLAAGDPVSEGDVDGWLAGPGLPRVRAAFAAIQEKLRRGQGGWRLVQVAKGWQLRTDVRFAPWVAAMRGGRPVRMSRASLETVAMVAYRQPISRAEIEELRGVDSGGTLKVLVERGLVAVTGRKDEPGRPLLYGTTPAFLAMFGLRDLSELPTLRDLRELRQDDPREGPGPADDDWELDGDFETEGDPPTAGDALQRPLPLRLHPRPREEE